MLGTIEEKISFTHQAAAAATRKQEAQAQQRQRLEMELEIEDVKHQHKAAQDSRGHQASTASITSHHVLHRAVNLWFNTSALPAARERSRRIYTISVISTGQ